MLKKEKQIQLQQTTPQKKNVSQNRLSDAGERGRLLSKSHLRARDTSNSCSPERRHVGDSKMTQRNPSHGSHRRKSFPLHGQDWWDYMSDEAKGLSEALLAPGAIGERAKDLGSQQLHPKPTTKPKATTDLPLSPLPCYGSMKPVSFRQEIDRVYPRSPSPNASMWGKPKRAHSFDFERTKTKRLNVGSNSRRTGENSNKKVINKRTVHFNTRLAVHVTEDWHSHERPNTSKQNVETRCPSNAPTPYGWNNNNGPVPHSQSGQGRESRQQHYNTNTNRESRGSETKVVDEPDVEVPTETADIIAAEFDELGEGEEGEGEDVSKLISAPDQFGSVYGDIAFLEEGFCLLCLFMWCH